MPTTHGLPDRVRIVDLSPRDGLQNEKAFVGVGDRIALINALIAAGVTDIEVGSFVSPRWVPQMAGTAEVLAAFANLQDRLYLPVLTPNLRGLDDAARAGAQTVAVFAAATEGFSRANLNGSRSESFARFTDVARAAITQGIRVRGYVSCAVHCPFDGWVEPDVAAQLAEDLMEIGCHEVSVCDTTGQSTPERAAAMVGATIARIGVENVAVHFHDTFGHALANTRASLEQGITSVDACVAGLGGCPYSPGAAGNLDTVTLVSALHDMGIKTSIDLTSLRAAGTRIRSILDLAPSTA